MVIATSTALLAASLAVSVGSMAYQMTQSNSGPKIPEAKIPAVAASGPRQDTGAQVKLGTSEVKDQRVSGTRKSSTPGQVDVLGGLGAGGGLSV